MTRIYSIHLVSPFSIKRIPNNASTHYTYTIYPTKDIAPKTQKGFAHKPVAQRKFAKQARPLAATQPVVTPVAKSKQKKQRSKFRKDINKRALAAYFDNDIKLSRAAAIQKWQDTVVAELAAADKIAAQNADIAREELRKFVEYVRHSVNYTTSEYGIYDEYDIDPNYDLYFGEFDNSELNPAPNNTELDEDDFFLFADMEPQYPHNKSLSIDSREQERTEINEYVVNRFTNKYDGADTAAAMRAFEKKKFHSATMPYILHKLQITK